LLGVLTRWRQGGTLPLVTTCETYVRRWHQNWTCAHTISDSDAGECAVTYGEQLAGDEGERARLRRHGEPAPVPGLNLEAFHLVLHDRGDHVGVAVRLHGHAGLRVRRDAVARQTEDVRERVQVRVDVLRPDAEALEDHRLHRSLQLRHVLGCRHDRVTA
jgi:hypothetical protein